jgi:hypothetical protein
MKKLGFIATLLFVQFIAFGQSANVNYTSSSATLINPERGFCDYSIVTVNGSGNFTALTASTFTALAAKNHSIIFRMYYLTPYTRVWNIPNSFLTKLQADFDATRAAGFKMILRFAYKEGVWPPSKPYNDAPKVDTVLNHISNLKNTILANSDVILSFQSGFWGLYGETYYTDNYGDISTETITAQHIADRKAIMDAMFTCVGPSRKLQTRTPPLKAAYYNQTIPADTITAAQAYNGTDKTRVGGYNDCFLADFNDYTYADTTTEKPFWATESKYTIMGGETCNDNATYTNCTNAQAEMRRFNWTFCNEIYNLQVINRWKSTSPGPACYSTISNNLGYRLVLLNGTYSSGTNLATFSYSITLKNEGYAAPVNPRNVELVFRNAGTNTVAFTRKVFTDPRRWYGGSTVTIAGTINTPTTLPTANYDVYLKFGDPEPTLTNVKYNIRTANGGSLWDAASGTNKLNHTVNLRAGSGVLPVKFISFTGQMINGSAKLDWSIAPDPTLTGFEVEFSTDAVLFSKIETKASEQNKLEYTAYHSTNVRDVVYYRIKAMHSTGETVYSTVVKLFGDRDDRLTLRSTICTSEIFVTAYYGNIGNIGIYDANGKQVYKAVVKNNTISINCFNWAKGIYFLQAENGKLVETKKVIVQ